MTRSFLIHRFVPLAVCAAVLAGCGVKSSPQHPDDSDFPRAYPAAQGTAPVIRQREQTREQNRTAPAPASGIYQYPNPPTYQPPKQ